MLFKFKKKDIIVLLILIFFIILAFFLISNRREGKVLQVKKNNEVIQEIDLSKDEIYTFNFDDQVNVLEIKNNSADVISADCYNQVCVNTAPISNEGEVIACLPHGLIFEVIENEN